MVFGTLLLFYTLHSRKLTIFVFCLVLLDVGCCEEVAFNEDAINHLVMEEERKILIKSLVNRYARGDVDGKVVQRKVSQPWTADFIKNKGDGQIFLLHGSPGVGKTYVSARDTPNDTLCCVLAC